MRFRVSLFILLLPSIAAADGLTDLRATLGRLAATTPAHGTLEVTSTSRSNDEDKPNEGKASVGFEIGEGGLHIVYPRAMLAQATQEARAEARDPERATPVRTGASQLRPLHVSDLLDGAAPLATLLESAQLLQMRPATFAGRPARLLLFKIVPKMSKAESKHVKKVDSALSVWIGDDGTPLGAEQSTSVKAGFLLITFDIDQKESWTYSRSGDRLTATRHEETNKSDGLGQHDTTRTLEVLRME
jgi:hypothetical protein